MNTKTLVSMALLIGIGTVLHTIIPGIIFNMKPDMMLTMMFLGIVLFPERKNVLLLGALTGVISGLTSTFPGGIVPNIIDKLITSYVFFGLYTLLSRKSFSAMKLLYLTIIGTIVSGTIFLTSALLLVGLPGPFLVLYITVLVGALFNAVAVFILYPILQTIFKRTHVIKSA
ncbi:tryptophan transporter [Bacillus sp. FJAT-49736]|uniref:tryptophan transporter n=1 Tax=Bacillus sp. FJAT-49736 TaxID=2833582 RepID=UPI001BC8D836|nr:tryptophan transporter [Bacillus sp. FJAT-49736]MBS4171893.1 tryptophan transporter [Bacillus sp. FJAT-49736]